jgi:tape measure domain-containing protein
MAFKIQGEFSLKGNAASSLKSIGMALKTVHGQSLKTSSSLERTKDSMNQTGREARSLGQNAERGARGLSTLGSAATRVGSMLKQAARVADPAWQNTANILRGAKDSIMGAFNLPNALMGGGLVAGAGFAGKSILDAVGYKEQQMISFTTMLGDSGKALKLYKWALKEADATPFETPDVLNATRSMLSYGFTLKEIPTLMRKFSDTSSGLGKGAAGLESLTNIFGQIRSKGKLQGDELLQLNQMGLGASKMLKDAYKGQDFQKALEGGRIAAEDAIGILLSGMGKFNGLGAAQAKSIFGLASTLKSRPFNLFQNLNADKEMLPVKNVLNNLITLTDFDKNPIGIKIRKRFTSSMNMLFGGAFGNLAKTTDPKVIGQTLDKVFDKIDSATSWVSKNGPGILKDFKAFFAGIGSTINSIRGAVDWASSSLSKVGNLLGGLGIKNALGDGTGIAKTLGMLTAGVLAVKTINGLLGGIPGMVLGKLGGGFGSGSSLGIQKVFVTNMGGLGGGLPDVGGLGNTKPPIGTLPKFFVDKYLPTFKSLFEKARTWGLGLAQQGKNLLGTLGSSLGGFGATFSGGLVKLSAGILGKLSLAAGAFGAGWGIGNEISKIETGKKKDGTKRTVASDVQDFFYNNLFGGRQLDAQLKQSQLEIARLKALAKKNGQAYGQGLQQGLLNSKGATGTAANNLSLSANAATKKAWQVKSPSRVSMGFGKMYGTGLKIGMDNTKNQVRSAGTGLGAAANAGTRGALTIQNPFQMGYDIALGYGDGLLLGLKQQLTPIQTAAKTLAAAVAVSSLPSFATANTASRDPLSASNLPPIGAISAPARAAPTIQITNNFGDINVLGADPQSARQVGQQIKEQARMGAEQGLLQAFEKLALQIGG